MQQQNEALKLWMREVSYRDIADELGVSLGTAYNRVQEALDNCRAHAEFDEYRKIQLAELQVARLKVRNVIGDWEHADDIKRLSIAMDSLIKIHEQ